MTWIASPGERLEGAAAFARCSRRTTRIASTPEPPQRIPGPNARGVARAETGGVADAGDVVEPVMRPNRRVAGGRSPRDPPRDPRRQWLPPRRPAPRRDARCRPGP